MSTFSTSFSADRFREESARELEQLRQDQAQQPQRLSNDLLVIAQAVAHHGVPVAAARVIAGYLDALEQRVRALEDAARTQQPAPLAESRTALNKIASPFILVRGA